MLLNCSVGEDSWESLGLQGDPTCPFWRRSVLGVHWKDWCWSWTSNILSTWCEELIHLKRPWCWERLRAGEEGADRGLRWLDGHHWFDGPEFGWIPGVVVGQGCLACCGSLGLKELDTTEWRNWTELNFPQSCPPLWDPIGCSPTGSSIHGIFQARILEWVAISSSRDIPNPGIKPLSLMYYIASLLFRKFKILIYSITNIHDLTHPQKFTILAFIFILMIHLELTFGFYLRRMSRFIFSPHK